MKLDPFTTALFALLTEQQRTGFAVLNWLLSNHEADRNTGRTYCIAATLIWRATIHAGDPVALWDHDQGRHGVAAVARAVQHLLQGLSAKLNDPALPAGYRIMPGQRGAPPALLFVGLPEAMPDFLADAPTVATEPPAPDEIDTRPFAEDDTPQRPVVQDEDDAIKNDPRPLPEGRVESWRLAWLEDLWHESGNHAEGHIG
jgi:hypothetical protein